MRILMATVGAIALAASVPALSQGNSGNRGGGPQAERGQQGGPSGRAGGNEARGQGNGGQQRGGPSQDRGNQRQADQGPGNREQGNRGPQAERGGGQGGGQGNAPASRGSDRERPAQAQNRGGGRPDTPGNAGDRGNAPGNRPAVADRGRPDGAGERRGRRSPALERFADNYFYRGRRFVDDGYRRRIIGFSDRAWRGSCPPGLARQNALCMPPGQYRKLFNVGSRFDRSGFGLPDWYRAARLTDLLFGGIPGRFDYRYAGGYAYRLDPETRLVLAAIPLLGGALGIGQPLPRDYAVYNVPVQYRPIYRDDLYHYRYGANAIYRVDRDTGLILGVSELLAPEFRVGGPVPAGYSVYNVPYGYRDRYYDTADSLYRYNNGRIYRIDPETRLVLAAIDVLT